MRIFLMVLVLAGSGAARQDQDAEHALNTWVKRTPIPGAPVSPRLGYEGDCVWDAKHQVILRYGGHNQGGGGEQHSEVWTFDPTTARWTLKEPNAAPPGVCCAQQNVFDPVLARYIRFPSFSGSHGWQWSREIYLNQSSVWTYDLETNTWRNRRPYPAPHLAPLRCASWDAGEQMVVVFGGEGSSEGTLVYDPYTNTWEWMKPSTQPEFRSGGNMTYDVAHHRHILFGSQFGKDPRTWAYEYPKTWRDLKPAALPPADKNDAVLAYDQASEKVIALIKITEGKDEEAKHTLETWAYDGEKNTWERMNPAREPDPSGNRARVLIPAPDRNLIFLEDCPSKPREQQIWSFRLQREEKTLRGASFPARTTLRTPEDVVVSVLSAREVEVSWKPPPKGQDKGSDSIRATSYVVERARVEVWTEDQLQRLKSRTPPLQDPSVGAVSAVGPFKRISKEPVKETSFVDREVTFDRTGQALGEPLWHRTMSKEELDTTGKAYRYDVYAYRIRAVSKGGESGPSEAVFTIPSMPQWIFSKEEAGTCHLKWAANPEKDVKGYRVYRMDGRFDKEPITRLTPDPIPGTSFNDPAAGKSSRRYYIVAVDALGQEGHPSMPVWHEREWKPYYKPFTGEWHQ